MTETATRTIWREVPIRAIDLAESDVFRHNGEWREVLDVWTDSNREDAAEAGEYDDALHRMTVKYLTGLNQWVIVRYHIERAYPGDIVYDFTAFRTVELVTVQAPAGTSPTS